MEFPKDSELHIWNSQRILNYIYAMPSHWLATCKTAHRTNNSNNNNNNNSTSQNLGGSSNTLESLLFIEDNLTKERLGSSIFHQSVHKSVKHFGYSVAFDAPKCSRQLADAAFRQKFKIDWL